MHTIDDIKVGMSASFGKRVSARDIELFGEVSGDRNPVHFDEAYAATTMFKTRIAHGMLGASFFSTVLGTKLPGPGTIYLSQSLKFKAPVKLGDEVTATCTAIAVDAARKRATFSCVAKVGEVVVIEGEAVVMPPAKS